MVFKTMMRGNFIHEANMCAVSRVPCLDSNIGEIMQEFSHLRWLG